MIFIISALFLVRSLVYLVIIIDSGVFVYLDCFCHIRALLAPLRKGYHIRYMWVLCDISRRIFLVEYTSLFFFCIARLERWIIRCVLYYIEKMCLFRNYSFLISNNLYEPWIPTLKHLWKTNKMSKNKIKDIAFKEEDPIYKNLSLSLSLVISFVRDES